MPSPMTVGMAEDYSSARGVQTATENGQEIEHFTSISDEPVGRAEKKEDEQWKIQR